MSATALTILKASFLEALARSGDVPTTQVPFFHEVTMTDKILYWASVVFGGLALLLFVADTALISGNRDLQAEISQRASVIESAARLTPLNQNLAQALAEASVKNNDKDIKELLAGQGITLRKPEKSKDSDKSSE